MALRNIVKLGDPILNKTSRKVEKFDDKLAALIDDMLETMYSANGVGLAAVQVGILKRVVVIDIGEGPMELVNPEITMKEGEQQESEGCLSLPGKYGVTSRPQRFRLKRRTETVNGRFSPVKTLKRALFAMKSTIWTVFCSPHILLPVNWRSNESSFYGHAGFCRAVSAKID